MKWNLSIYLESDPFAIRAVRKMLYSALVDRGVSATDARSLEFAMGEILENARGHASPETTVPLIVDLAFDLPSVVFTVQDHITPVSIPTAPATLPENSEALGLYAIGLMMDSVDIQQKNGNGVSITVARRVS